VDTVYMSLDSEKCRD